MYKLKSILKAKWEMQRKYFVYTLVAHTLNFLVHIGLLRKTCLNPNKY